jgi:CubicO group peptidase (beta-lactamase class C family)
LSPQINGEELFFSGYQWWLGRSLVAKREIRWASAVGYGGQRLYIIPDRDMVVCVTAGLYGGPVFQGLPGEIILRRYALAATALHPETANSG